MTPLEALADAINQFEGWHKGSRAWRNRNPGNLRPTILAQPRDAENYRIFGSMSQGWEALCNDLSAKFDGSHGLTPNSTLLDLLNVYAPAGDQNDPTAYAKFVCSWVSDCLERKILPSTTLGEYVNPPGPGTVQT